MSNTYMVGRFYCRNRYIQGVRYFTFMYDEIEYKVRIHPRWSVSALATPNGEIAFRTKAIDEGVPVELVNEIVGYMQKNIIVTGYSAAQIRAVMQRLNMEPFIIDMVIDNLSKSV